jgi:sulfide:quinone oxidoreductase
MHARVLVLGAGFGGLELATMLSEAFGEDAGVTLIDAADAFVFGFSKLDVLFGRTTADKVLLPYRDFVKPGVTFRRETIVAIDPQARRVTTNDGTYEAGTIVVALGADYDIDGTPGLAESNEFYTLHGAERLSKLLPEFTAGRALIGICGAPYKCPPAPSEAALLLHDYLQQRGVRDACEITLLSPLSAPVPPSPETSRALLAAFAERRIRFIADREVLSLDLRRRVAVIDDGSELPFDLFLGVPKQQAARVLERSGMTVDGYVPVNRTTLETKFPGIYAIGDCALQGTPKAGVFSEGAARAVGASLIAQRRGEKAPAPHAGTGSCYIEFGGGRVGRVDVDFFTHSEPTGTYYAPSAMLRAEKDDFGSSRRDRWFNRS